ncbi:MAG TPA: GNAT family N-acetyltransferase, partial [Acidimicrobiales bacterium]
MDTVEQRLPGSVPEGYPAAYEADVVLTDGATAHVRPIRPGDGDLLLAFHERQSPQSIYYRYFSPRPRLSDKDVERLINVDYVDRMALIALRGDDMIGVARYDRWRHRGEAEVAFFVDDANHGRGLATLLLEHLAVRAREIGLTAFTASVLPENRKMIGVFTQAGFETVTKFADGVIEVRLGLSPTSEAEAKIADRARAAASEAVRRLLSPNSVAVIGASRERGTISRDLLNNLQASGFEGPIYPVNPSAHHVGSVRSFPSVLDVPDDVDLAVIVVPAEKVAEVMEECGRKRVYGAVVLSAGFAEQGEAGAALEAEVLRVARSWGIRLVGPNCLGIINTDPSVRLHATFAPVVPRRGRVSLLSESGMVGAAIIARAREVGVGISSFVALGNRADVSGNDMLQYWADDDHTDVVCMYIESFGNARHFSRLARQLTRAKPVVAVKTGLAPGGEGLATLGDDTDEVLLRQTGVIEAPTLTSLLATARLLISQPLPAGRRVAVLGNAG